MNINESSLARVWQHTSGDAPFAIITAFRGEYTREQNLQRNRSLSADIRNLGYGFFFLDGFWVENKGTDDERHVAEDSLFVIGDEGTDQDFLRQMVKLAKQNNQDGVLVKTDDGVKVYDKNGGEMFDVGNFAPGAAGEAYSKLRNNKKSNTFIFKEERDDIGWIGRLAGIHKI